MTKAERILEYLNDHPMLRHTSFSEDTTSQPYYKNYRGRVVRRKATSKGPRLPDSVRSACKRTGSSITAEDLLSLKKFTEKFGTSNKVMKCLDILEELQS